MEQNLSQYKIFYEVAKAGNISKAAKELYISQPAISKAISKLEDSLGLSQAGGQPGPVPFHPQFQGRAAHSRRGNPV